MFITKKDIGNDILIFKQIYDGNLLRTPRKNSRQYYLFYRSYFQERLTNNSTLRYECDETFSDECEFAARAEGE